MSYTFDKISLMKEGKRWFPVMGEIHYSRVPNQTWAEELYKMKAGGVNVASAYTIWIHHEEIENQYDWTGDRNLHEFIKTASECDMKILLRIGPWCHGEARNGGFPDWLLKKDFNVRTNDEKYFATVEKWYKAVFAQVSEFVGNTIIGVQIENEFGHCGGLSDETGEVHMQRLTKMAKEIGFNVDLYTATGWGGARTGGLLPVMGGYCDAPWDQRTTEIEPSGNYVFTHERNDHNIGSDYGFGHGITFDIEKFPYLTAELGGGLQVTKHRRTIATPKDIASVATVKLGSGCNLLGFYMYHGGTNPDGKLTTLQESRETGYPNDLPIKSYDFRAPVREFGQVSDTFRELKLLSYFTADFGEEICELPAIIPEENPLDPNDVSNLRYSYRSNGEKGYLFVNNYVRHQTLASHSKEFVSPDKKTVLPKFDISNGDFFFVPFNLTFGKTTVKTATVTPLCKLPNNDDFVVFYKRDSDSNSSSFFDVENQSTSSKFLVLSRRDALNLWKTKNRIFITDDDCYVLDESDSREKFEVVGRKNSVVCVYPDFDVVPSGWKKVGMVNKQVATDLSEVIFTQYQINCLSEADSVSFSKVNENTFKFDLSKEIAKIGKDSTSDVFVSISYVGESAKLFANINGERKLLLDDFWMGEDYPWEIGLKRFVGSNIDFSSLELEISSLEKDAKIYIEKMPKFDGSSICCLNSISCESEWRVKNV